MARACSVPEASIDTLSVVNVNRSGADRSSTSDTRRTASASSAVFTTAWCSVCSGNSRRTGGKLPLISSDVTVLLPAVKAMISRSPEPEKAIEMSPPWAKVLPTSVRVRAGTSAVVGSSDAVAPPSHGISRSATR